MNKAAPWRMVITFGLVFTSTMWVAFLTGGKMKRKLTNEDLRNIRKMHREGLGYSLIARSLGVGKSTIRDALTYRTQYSARVI